MVSSKWEILSLDRQYFQLEYLQNTHLMDIPSVLIIHQRQIINSRHIFLGLNQSHFRIHAPSQSSSQTRGAFISVQQCRHSSRGEQSFLASSASNDKNHQSRGPDEILARSFCTYREETKANRDSRHTFRITMASRSRGDPPSLRKP